MHDIEVNGVAETKVRLGLRSLAEIAAAVVIMGGGFILLKADVDTLKRQVERMEIERVDNSRRLARIEANVEFMVDEMRYLRQMADQAAKRKLEAKQ